MSAVRLHALQDLQARVDALRGETVLGSVPAEVVTHPWDIINLADLPDTAPPEATILCRTDGVGLVYPGVRNLLFAPFESSKTFVALLACKQLLDAGRSILYIDFESSARAIASRLRQMGAPLDRFGYIRPTLPVDNDKLTYALDSLNPDLVVVDACAEAMVTHNLDENNNGDFMKFSRLMLEPLEARGHAVLLLDHLGKAQGEEMKKYPRGASAKMATISGSALRIEVETPFRRGHSDGLARVYVAKDREGAVRQYSTAETLVAYLHLMNRDGVLTVELDPPAGPAAPVSPKMGQTAVSAVLIQRAAERAATAQPAPSRAMLEDIALHGQVYGPGFRR